MMDFRSGTRAVIFDLDGVIADSEPVHQEGFRRLFGELGIPALGIDDWHRFVGTSDRTVLVRLLDGRDVGRDVDALLDRKAAIFLELVSQRPPLYPMIPALVEELAASYVLAVASGSLRTMIAAVLEMGGIRKFFRHAVSVQDVAHGKPAPDLFLRAANLLGVSPAACVVIEDSVPGVRGAKAAGMRVIAIPNTTSADQLASAEADAVATEGYGQVRRWLLGEPGPSDGASRSLVS